MYACHSGWNVLRVHRLIICFRTHQIANIILKMTAKDFNKNKTELKFHAFIFILIYSVFISSFNLDMITYPKTIFHVYKICTLLSLISINIFPLWSMQKHCDSGDGCKHIYSTLWWAMLNFILNISSWNNALNHPTLQFTLYGSTFVKKKLSI